MLTPQWEEQLRKAVAGLNSADGPPRIAVVGVGHPWRGDDAAGVAVARLLELLARDPALQVIEAGPAPERCWRLLLPFRPHLILFVDAADMRTPPGSVHWLEWECIAAGPASTHTLPLPVLAAFLGAELSCGVAVLGIQPGNVDPGTALTPAVEQAVAKTATALAVLLQASEGVWT